MALHWNVFEFSKSVNKKLSKWKKEVNVSVVQNKDIIMTWTCCQAGVIIVNFKRIQKAFVRWTNNEIGLA